MESKVGNEKEEERQSQRRCGSWHKEEKMERAVLEEWEYGICIKGVETKDGKCNGIGIYNNEGIGKVEESLKRVCNEMEINDFLLVIGDFNARI